MTVSERVVELVKAIISKRQESAPVALNDVLLKTTDPGFASFMAKALS